MKRILVVAISAIALLVAGGALAVGVGNAVFGPMFQTKSESSNTQIIQAVERKEQVVLTSLGIQGISTKNEKSVIFGVEVPGSERASFIQYSFNAKLGIEGENVTIAEAGPGAFVVTIPEFIFIGHSNEEFKLAAENNGVLSWVTPQIDTVEMINKILNDDTKAEYVRSNSELLRDQAKMFYSGIIKGIDPTISLEFRFADESK